MAAATFDLSREIEREFDNLWKSRIRDDRQSAPPTHDRKATHAQNEALRARREADRPQMLAQATEHALHRQRIFKAAIEARARHHERRGAFEVEYAAAVAARRAERDARDAAKAQAKADRRYRLQHPRKVQYVIDADGRRTYIDA